MITKRILLIGDFARDVFINVDCPRISPEKPVPVVVPCSVRENYGMAGNVFANLRSLGPDIEVTTFFSDPPSVKTRYVDRASNQHFLRVDQDVRSAPLDAKTILDALDSQTWDAVIMSDYAKGYLNPDNMGAIALLCEKKGIPTWVDTKAILGEWSQPITVVKINMKEYAAQLTAGVKEPWLQCKNLIVTKGDKGMMLLDEDGGCEYLTKPNPINLRDVVGCGDTALAALVVGYIETQDLTKAMDFAGKASEVAASKTGVVAVKREEVG